jgi:iron-sulfur cluster assembly protein
MNTFAAISTSATGVPMSTTEATTTTRKPPILMTDRAVTEVQRIMANKQIPEAYGLRVGVKGGGCSGMSYILGFDKKREHDLEFDLEGIPLFLDKRHGLYLMGVTVDYHDGLNARGFIFENPNATQTCGCGSSFAV